MKNEKEIKYFSMFTGVGGFELGFERTNDNKEAGRCGQEESISKQGSRNSCSESNKRQHTFSCVGFSEIDKYANQVLRYRFSIYGKGIKNYGDATKINPKDLPEFDLLCGGFPCQAFSIAGKRRGFEDTRGTMFFEIARILKAKRPKIVLLENVKGLLNHQKGKTFRVILQTISELGYDVQWMVLNSKFFGVPQNRERVFIIGSLRGTGKLQILPFRETMREDNESCERKTTGAVKWGWGKIQNDATYLIHNVYGGFKEGVRKFKEFSPTIRTSKGRGHLPMVRQLNPSKESGGKQPYQQNRIYDKKGLSPALPSELGKDRSHLIMNTIQEAVGTRAGSSASFKKSVNNINHATGQIRRLTPIECERLQGFPDDWTRYGTDEKGVTLEISDTQRYKMMGNAVTVNVIEQIARRLKCQITS